MTRRAASISSIVAVGLVATMAAAPARAETVDKLTYLTFSGRVQIPGTTLGAGTYRFRLTNPSTARNIVQVLSHDGSTVYAMFHTTPDHRTVLTNESTVTFRETPAGVPPAVKSLFYGGEHDGYEFVYPKTGPILISEISSPQPEITFTPSTAVVTESSTAARAEAMPAPVPEAAPAEPAAAEAQASAQPAQPQGQELVHTASPVPLVALGGLASIILGFGASAIRKLIV